MLGLFSICIYIHANRNGLRPLHVHMLANKELHMDIQKRHVRSHTSLVTSCTRLITTTGTLQHPTASPPTKKHEHRNMLSKLAFKSPRRRLFSIPHEHTIPHPTSHPNHLLHQHIPGRLQEHHLEKGVSPNRVFGPRVRVDNNGDEHVHCEYWGTNSIVVLVS